MRYSKITLSLLFVLSTIHAQTIKVDSLINLFNKATLDSSKINFTLQIVEASNDDREWLPFNRKAASIVQRNLPSASGKWLDRLNYYQSQILNNFGYLHHTQGNYDSALYYYHLSSNLLEKLSCKKEEVVIISNMAGIHISKGEALQALPYYEKCLNLRKQINDTLGIAKSLYHLGMTYKMLGQVKKGIEFYNESIRLFDQLKIDEWKAHVLNGIGTLLEDQGNDQEALNFYRQSYNVYRSMNDVKSMATELNNMGHLYSDRHKSDSALYYYKLALKNRIEINDQNGLGGSYHNLGMEYLDENPELAISYLNKSYEIFKRLQVKDGLAQVCNGLAWAYSKTNSDQALVFAKEGLLLATETQNTELLEKLNHACYMIYDAKHDYFNALQHYRQYKLFEDSLINVTNKEAAFKGKMQYEFDTKELVLKNERERASLLQKQEISRQRWIIYSVVFGLVIVIAFSFFLYNRFKVIRAQKKIIEAQKEIVEEKQKEIVDSIKYAKRIQTSIITSEKYIAKNMERLNKPSQ